MSSLDAHNSPPKAGDLNSQVGNHMTFPSLRKYTLLVFEFSLSILYQKALKSSFFTHYSADSAAPSYQAKLSYTL